MDTRRSLLQVARFGVVGITATAVNGGIYWLATARNWTNPLSANTLGFAIAFGVSFLGHRHWTFADSGPSSTGTSLLRFLVTALTGFGLNSLATWVLTGPLGLPALSALPVIVLATPVVLFVLSKYWAFASHGNEGGAGR